MSSAGATGSSSAAAAVTAEKRYLCHQCNRTFTAAGTRLACAHCHGDFVEEFDLPDRNPNPAPHPGRYFRSSFDDVDAFPAFPSLLSAFVDLAAAAAAAAVNVENPSVDASADPLSSFSAPSLRDLVQAVSFGGAAGSGGRGRHFMGNIGDYFVGPGLDQLIQRLSENDPNQYGTPPASKAAVESLPDVKITEGLLASDEAQCSVCMDLFEMDAVAKQMPCNHVYHKECILPWLELHNSCPVCRYELPTDDPDYERHRTPRSNAVNPGGGLTTGAVAGEVDGNLPVRTSERSSGDHGYPASGTH
ncbi:unnamed protein product [Musa acuminata subsp. malaccensis]|uniref:RING-type E3 ubiquitin transferase n=1 Tax=Musa acuminata subsp. malaccensis TaxID=214687 RepID=A0A804J732_MUSAM|nr:PREDICTED: E3 ubiquitin-protein ligase RING1-like [Musa acuminata subsp. malaccensis]CAG1839196.1 unnamed protein product [Musa acuminata subsp. malaccensis]